MRLLTLMARTDAITTTNAVAIGGALLGDGAKASMPALTILTRSHSPMTIPLRPIHAMLMRHKTRSDLTNARPQTNAQASEHALTRAGVEDTIAALPRLINAQSTRQKILEALSNAGNPMNARAIDIAQISAGAKAITIAQHLTIMTTVALTIKISSQTTTK